MMSPARTGLLASAALAGMAWCLYRVFGPRPLRRDVCPVVPPHWVNAIMKYTTVPQFAPLIQELCAIPAPALTTEAAYNVLARFVSPAQLQSITSDPAWAQGQLELARGGLAP